MSSHYEGILAELLSENLIHFQEILVAANKIIAKL